MHIAIIGYGKMGVEVEKILRERGHTVTLRATSKSGIEVEMLKKSDVAIEFTNPHAAPNNLLMCLQYGVPVVTGSTGWFDQLPAISEAFEKNGGALLHATNFSLGVNLFFAVNAFLTEKLNTHGGYDIRIHEIHHTKKLDAPSGTAITTAQTILNHSAAYKTWKHGNTQLTDEISVTHERIEDVPGTHVVTYHGKNDQIEIKHTAFNRKDFAFGAVLAAEWISGKRGIYTMKDVLRIDF